KQHKGMINAGWIDDPNRHVVARPFGTLSQIAPRLVMGVQAGEASPVLLYKAWMDVIGKYPDYHAQEIGDCVSHGHGHGNDMLQCIEVALGEASEYRETDTEFIYA